MRLTRALFGLVIVVLAAASQGCNDGESHNNVEGLLTSESTDGQGEVCVPVDKDGTGSFAWEAIRNSSSQDVRIVGVHAAGDDVEVVDWFLAPKEWEGGVRSGEFAPRDRDSFRSEVLPQGQDALIAFSLQTQDLPTPALKIEVDYEVSDASGTLPLNWEARLVAAHESCNMNG